MYLTPDEEDMLSGERGSGLQKAMEILVSIGGIYDAERLIDVSKVQISGVSYKTIGDAGLEFLEDISSDARINILATLNPAGVDLEDDKLRTPPDFIEKQKRILSAYKRLGATPSCTCTPYLAGNLPAYGEHVAWAESSAVAYGNSVIGARTNRESAITALASAIAGKTPLYGLHLLENRMPTFKVNVDANLESVHDYSSLGYYVGKHFDGIPLFTGVKPGVEGLKALSAGLATGRVSMFHIDGLTPDKYESPAGSEQTDFTSTEKKEVIDELNTCDDPDIICIGCPHCTKAEIDEVIRMNPSKEVWVYTSRGYKKMFQDRVKNDNIKLVSDTCMVVQPLEEMGIKSLGTNSTKCAYYSRGLSGLDVRFAEIDELLK